MRDLEAISSLRVDLAKAALGAEFSDETGVGRGQRPVAPLGRLDQGSAAAEQAVADLNHPQVRLRFGTAPDDLGDDVVGLALGQQKDRLASG